MILALIVLLGVVAGTSSSGVKQGCVNYEPDTVTLRGRIVRRTFAGPPNYESIARGDEREQVWLLHLAKPICVSPGTDSPKETSVSDVQLVFTEGRPQYDRYRPLVGQQVIASGTLFHAITGHHHTKVLLTVDGIKKR
jgi:hypothetical protein